MEESEARTVLETDLDRLFKLQLLDGAIRAAREALQEHPHRKEAESLRSQLEALERADVDTHESIKSLRRTVRSAELELKSAEDEARQIEARLYSGAVANPKELESLQQRLETFRTRIDRLQETVISRMIELEETEKRGQALRGERQATGERLQEASSRWEATRQALERELARLEQERADLASRVTDPTYLSRYERLASAKGGHAIAVVQDDRCGGCGVPLSNYYRIETRRKGRMMLCEVCGRILYWPPPGGTGKAQVFADRA
ncbi:hypothetical protein U7230_06445 [Carboxydochorda subterranea]|uniref:CT398-like coiled coil hairpin domain-containing protein n=1 Tax=Carboxydichorda subterranea TaxID=3109565 RepID=A0ABZ1C112_9FIRM|nr:hypothetical protein [Limnochorda sp. L945t]WRP18634.1 hypothetical protein U7230_06445 [Limnochorda sp. L945t]